MDTKKLRQKILDLAIHGKLVPQDPNDEPASVLLEHIRKEKEQLIKEGKIKKSKKSTKTSDTPHYENVPFEVPSGWVWCKIDDIAFVTKLAGFEYTNYIVGELEKGGSIPLFKGKNIKDGHIVYSFESYITKEISDLLYRSQISRKCLLTPYVGTIGNIAIHDKEGVFHLGSNVGKIELFNSQSHGVLEEYVLAFLRSSSGYKELVKHRKATAQESISIEAIRDVCVPFPPINEQQKIVAEIERWFALVDIIEQGKDTLQATIAQAKSKILDLAIHGKLVPQDPSDEPAIELLRRINPKFTPCDNAQYENIPSKWSVCKLSDVAYSELGKTLDRERNTGNMHPYLCSINILWNKIDLSTIKEMKIEDKELDKYKVEHGDLLICEGGESGRCAIWDKDTDIYYQNALHRVRFTHGVSAKFFMYQLDFFARSGNLDKYVKGVTIKHLTKTALNSIPFYLPPIKEQLRIVEAIENIYITLDAIQSSIEAQ